MGQADPSFPFVSGVVLAAGAATRMGRPKQLMQLGGRSILSHVLDGALQSQLSEVVLVLGAREQEIRAGLALPPDSRVHVIVNDDFAHGMSTSLRCGLRACDPRAEAAAVLLGDQPEIDAALIDRVLTAFAKARAPLTRPMFRAASAYVPGHPVVLARSVWPELDMLHGDEGARVLFTRAPERVHEVLIPVSPPADIDTLEDYRLAREHGETAPIVPRKRTE